MKTSLIKTVSLVAILVGAHSVSFAQTNEPAPPKPKEDVPKTKAETVKVVYEVFSLPITPAAEIQRAGVSDEVFYAKMLEGLKEKTVKQETLLIARGMSGQKVEVSEGREYSYATEFEPPELPNAVAGTSEKSDGKKEALKIFPVTPAQPTAFDTKLLGDAMEVEVQLADPVIDLRIAPTRASFIQKDVTGQGVARMEMPRFANPKLVTSVSTKSGKPSYLGTVSAPAELQPGESEQRVFFAFVTATKISQ